MVTKKVEMEMIIVFTQTQNLYWELLSGDRLHQPEEREKKMLKTVPNFFLVHTCRGTNFFLLPQMKKIKFLSKIFNVVLGCQYSFEEPLEFFFNNPRI